MALYYTNSTLNFQWEDLANWNYSPDGTGANPSEVPWSGQDGSTSGEDLVYAAGTNYGLTISDYTTIGGGITATCSIPYLTNYGAIMGGTWTGTGFFNQGRIYDGLFSNAWDGEYSFANYEPYNDNQRVAVIYGGTFTSYQIENGATINGGLFTGDNFQNYSGDSTNQTLGGLINGGTFRGSNFNNQGTEIGDIPAVIYAGSFEINGFTGTGRVRYYGITITQDGDPYTGTWQEHAWDHGHYVEIPILYFSGYGAWDNLANWNTAPDGSGEAPLNIPWTDDGFGGAYYASTILTGGALNIHSALVIDPNHAVTGYCDSYVGVSGGTISGGTFTNSDYCTNEGLITGGTFTGDHFQNAYDFPGIITGGLFTGNYFANGGNGNTYQSYITGGVFTGHGMQNLGYISYAQLEINGFTNYPNPLPPWTGYFTYYHGDGINYSSLTTTNNGDNLTGGWAGQNWSNGIWQESQSVNTLYFVNLFQDDDYYNLGNWNTAPDSNGVFAYGVPWTSDGQGGYWYANYTLLTLSGAAIPSTLYYTNAYGDSNWETLSNWNTAPDGSGLTPPAIPWTDNGSGGGIVSGTNLVDTTPYGYIVINNATIIVSGITGSCSIRGINNFAIIHSGTWTGGGFFNSGLIYDGLFDTPWDGEYSFSNYEPTNSGSRYAVIFGGTFTGFSIENNATIQGGTFTGDNFQNYNGANGIFYTLVTPNGLVYGGTFTGNNFNNQGVQDGLNLGAYVSGITFSGSGFYNGPAAQVINSNFTEGHNFSDYSVQGCYFKSDGTVKYNGYNYTYNGEWIAVTYPQSGRGGGAVDLARLIGLPFFIKI